MPLPTSLRALWKDHCIGCNDLAEVLAAVCAVVFQKWPSVSSLARFKKRDQVGLFVALFAQTKSRSDSRGSLITLNSVNTKENSSSQRGTGASTFSLPRPPLLLCKSGMHFTSRTRSSHGRQLKNCSELPLDLLLRIQGVVYADPTFSFKQKSGREQRRHVFNGRHAVSVA